MTKAKLPPLSIDTLWQLQRLGAPSLSPCGRMAVLSVATPSMEDNRSTSALWLLPTDRAAPRRLTHCGSKDGQPAFSPRGDRIAFIATREQEGHKDDTPQLYLIAPDGGEATRASRFAPGIESFRWLPDGRGVVFAAWVWPDETNAEAQNKRFKAWKERKESGYATSEAYHRYWDHVIPQGRVLRLHHLDLKSGRVRDLFAKASMRGLELPRDAGGNSDYAVHPQGTHVAFMADLAPEKKLGNRQVLLELELKTGRVRVLADHADWDFAAPSYHPQGRHIALLAAHVGRAHTAYAQPVVLERPAAGRKAAPFTPPKEDRALCADAPLLWAGEGMTLLYTAEDRGRRPLWRHDMQSGAREVAWPGGWVHGFDHAGGSIVACIDSARHPPQCWVRREAAAPQRLEHFNDRLLAGVALGDLQEVNTPGALGEPVQAWLTFPPGFDKRRRHAVTHVIHGGPFAAAGDTWSWRWNPHVLASEGAVVVQVNYHGSSGFGQAWREGIVGRQGELECADIEAHTDWLLKQPWVDKKRITATGGSYGGFLVAWMNGHVAPGRYQAYVCHAGVFDRVATFSADSWPQRPKDLAANYWDDMPRVLAQSPMSAAGAMQTPTLVIHGAKDYRVPDCNGLAYYNTLKARGVPARLLWFADENHWILKPRNSRQWTQEFLQWVRQWAPPARR